jgi:hypothetical protein
VERCTTHEVEQCPKLAVASCDQLLAKDDPKVMVNQRDHLKSKVCITTASTQNFTVCAHATKWSACEVFEPSGEDVSECMLVQTSQDVPQSGQGWQGGTAEAKGVPKAVAMGICPHPHAAQTGLPMEDGKKKESENGRERVPASLSASRIREVCESSEQTSRLNLHSAAPEGAQWRNCTKHHKSMF